MSVFKEFKKTFICLGCLALLSCAGLAGITFSRNKACPLSDNSSTTSSTSGTMFGSSILEIEEDDVQKIQPMWSSGDDAPNNGSKRYQEDNMAKHQRKRRKQ